MTDLIMEHPIILAIIFAAVTIGLITYVKLKDSFDRDKQDKTKEEIIEKDDFIDFVRKGFHYAGYVMYVATDGRLKVKVDAGKYFWVWRKNSKMLVNRKTSKRTDKMETTKEDYINDERLLRRELMKLLRPFSEKYRFKQVSITIKIENQFVEGFKPAIVVTGHININGTPNNEITN